LSGGGETAAGPSLEWFISLGNILGIVISVTVVVGAIFTLVRYLRKNVTKEVLMLKDSVKQDMTHVIDKLSYQSQKMNEGFETSKERMEELKQNISKLENRIDMNREELLRQMEFEKEDLKDRISARGEESKQLTRQLDTLREEYHRLDMAVSNKIFINTNDESSGSSSGDEHKEEEDKKRKKRGGKE